MLVCLRIYSVKYFRLPAVFLDELKIHIRVNLVRMHQRPDSTRLDSTRLASTQLN